MIKKFIALFLLALSLHAQTVDMQFSISNMPDSSRAVEITFQLNNMRLTGDGFIIELPEALHGFVTSIRHNDNTIWIKNSAGFPLTEQTAHWQSDSSRLIFRLNRQLLQTAINLSVSIIASVPEQKHVLTEVVLYNFRQLDNGYVQKGSVIVGKNLLLDK